MQVGKLDSIGDRFDLTIETSNVGIGDVGHLLKDKVFDLPAVEELNQEPGALVQQQRVPWAQRRFVQWISKLTDPLLVGAAGDDRPPSVRQNLPEGNDVTRAFAIAGQHDVERLVEDDFVASVQLAGVEIWVHRHPQLSPAREHVSGAVVVQAQHCAVAARWFGELGYLGTQRRKLISGLPQGLGERLILRASSHQVTLDFEHLLLECFDPMGLLLESPTQSGDLVQRGVKLALVGLSCLVVVHGPTPSMATLDGAFGDPAGGRGPRVG